MLPLWKNWHQHSRSFWPLTWTNAFHCALSLRHAFWWPCCQGRVTFLLLMQIFSFVSLIATDLRATGSWILTLNFCLLAVAMTCLTENAKGHVSGELMTKMTVEKYCLFSKKYKSIFTFISSIFFKVLQFLSGKLFIFQFCNFLSGNELSVLQPSHLVFYHLTKVFFYSK